MTKNAVQGMGAAGNTGASIYRNQNRKKYVVLAILFVVCVASLIVDVMTGAAMMPVGDVLA